MVFSKQIPVSVQAQLKLLLIATHNSDTVKYQQLTCGEMPRTTRGTLRSADETPQTVVDCGAALTYHCPVSGLDVSQMLK